MNKTPFLSLYKNVKTQENKDISIDDYISFVRAGANSNLVIDARLAKQKGNLERYKELKNQSQDSPIGHIFSKNPTHFSGGSCQYVIRFNIRGFNDTLGLFNLLLYKR